MKEIYIYDTETDQFQALDEMTDVDFLEVAEIFSDEAEMRVWESLDTCEATIEGEAMPIEVRLTLMIDGEPTEIDPLSYEVGYSHGQTERPKGEWIDKSGGIDGAWNYCSVCDEQAIIFARTVVLI